MDLPAVVDVNLAVVDVHLAGDDSQDFDLAVVNVNLAVDDSQDSAATTSPVDGDQVDDELLIEPPKPSKPIRARPKTSNKFGRGKRRGGDHKTTRPSDPILPAPQAVDAGGVAGFVHYHPPTTAKKTTKEQLRIASIVLWRWLFPCVG